MYKSTKWLDKVVDAETGELIQEGTDQNAANFNNMEAGIHDAHVATALLQIFARLMNEEVKRIPIIENDILNIETTKMDIDKIEVYGGVVDKGAIESISYPVSHGPNNCVVLSCMVSDGLGGCVDARGLLSVELAASEIRINNSSGDKSYDFTLVLYKY